MTKIEFIAAMCIAAANPQDCQRQADLRWMHEHPPAPIDFPIHIPRVSPQGEVTIIRGINPSK